MRGVEEKSVREQQIEIGRSAARSGRSPLFCRPERHEQSVDCRSVVLGGAETLAIGGAQGGQQNVGLR